MEHFELLTLVERDDLFLETYVSMIRLADNILDSMRITYDPYWDEFFTKSSIKEEIQTRTAKVVSILERTLTKRKSTYIHLYRTQRISLLLAKTLYRNDTKALLYLKEKWQDPTYFIKEMRGNYFV